MNLKDKIKDSEGFRGSVYEDSEGFDTIGYGTKLPITKVEGEMLLNYRLLLARTELVEAKSIILALPENKQDVLFEMAYQMGVSGVLKFKMMFAALERGDYKEAAKQMLDSRWNVQTPNRAKKLAELMRA